MNDSVKALLALLVLLAAAVLAFGLPGETPSSNAWRDEDGDHRSMATAQADWNFCMQKFPLARSDGSPLRGRAKKEALVQREYCMAGRGWSRNVGTPSGPEMTRRATVFAWLLFPISLVALYIAIAYSGIQMGMRMFWYACTAAAILVLAVKGIWFWR